MGTYTKTWDTTTSPDGVHSIYAVIKDTSGLTANTGLVSFNVVNNPVDASPAIISVGVNNVVLPAGTSLFQMVCQTSEDAICRYSTVAGTSFANMVDVFTNTGGTAHSTTILGLLNGKAYTYYIRSIDQFGNANNVDYPVSFSVDTPAPASITVMAPDGGENLKLGREKSFYWNSYGITGDIKLELSRNGGLTYQTLFVTPNSGSANWTVSGSRSNNCRVRFSSVVDPTIFDLSTGVFKIT